MKYLVCVLAVSAVVGIASWALTANAEKGASETASRTDHADLAGLRGMYSPDGKLFTVILGETANGRSYLQRCYFDAAVSLNDGRVGVIVSTGTLERVEVDQPVRDLPEGLTTGISISGPVHVDAHGRVVAGYSSCEELPQ